MPAPVLPESVIQEALSESVFFLQPKEGGGDADIFASLYIPDRIWFEDEKYFGLPVILLNRLKSYGENSVLWIGVVRSQKSYLIQFRTNKSHYASLFARCKSPASAAHQTFTRDTIANWAKAKSCKVSTV